MVAIMSIISYSDALNRWWVGGDSFLLVTITSQKSINEIFITPYLSTPGFTDIALYWRPVLSIFTKAVTEIAGPSPASHVAANIGLHVFTAISIGYFTSRLIERPIAGYITAFLFALHPLGVQVVPVVSRRGDILMTLLLVLSLYSFVFYDGLESRIVAAILITLAILTKEFAIFFTPIFPLYSWYSFSGEIRNKVSSFLIMIIPFSALGIMYIVARVAVLGQIGGKETSIILLGRITGLAGYGLSFSYPYDSIGAVATATPQLALVFPVIGILLGIAYKYDRFKRGLNPNHIYLLIISLIIISTTFLVPYIALPFDTEDPLWVRWIVTGALWGMVVVGVVVTTIDFIRREGTWTDLKPLSIPILWIALPLISPLLFGFSLRSGYSIMAGFCILFSILFTLTTDYFSSFSSQSISPGLIYGIFLLLLLTPLVIATPALHDYGWDSAGKTGEQTYETLVSVDEEKTESIKVRGVATQVEPHGRFSAHSLPVMQEYAYRYLLRRHGFTNISRVEGVILDHPPDSTYASQSGNTILIHYLHNRSEPQ